MQQLITSKELGCQLIKVLGLPDKVTAIDISLRPGAAVVLTVERMMGVDETGGLIHELSRFGLVDMEPSDPIERAADKALEEINIKYQAALNWLDAKHVSNCYALAEGYC